jgi:hypothetical protein
MKFNAALAKTLLMAASIGIVIPIGAQTNAPRANANKPSSPETPAPDTTDLAEAEIALPGSVIERADGGFLSLSLEGNKFKLAFYDAKKKPIAADVVRAIARWDPVNKSGEERSVLNPSEDGQTLRGNVFVRPPFTFRVFLALIGADGNVVESHIVKFRG